MEVLHVMPRKFLEENDALDIAEIQAYYQIKAEDRALEEDLRRQEAVMEEQRQRDTRRRRR